MSRRAWNALLVILLLAGPAWIWISRVQGETAVGALPPAPAIGHPAPAFTLATLEGTSLSLDELRGRPVILNFWATWCPPCRAELPELEAAARRHGGELVVIGVNQAEPAAAVQSFTSAAGLSFPIPLDDDARVSRLYGVRSLPTTFFVDRDGTIRQIQVGALTEATLAQLLRSVYP